MTILVAPTADAQLLQPKMVLSIDEVFKKESLGLGLNYKIVQSEPANRLTPQQVLAQEDWETSEQDSLSFGFSVEPRWVVFGVRNTSKTDQELILEVSNPYLDYIDVYLLEHQGNVLSHTPLGDKYPALKRPIRHANFLYSFTLKAGAKNIVLMRVETTSTNRIPISLWDHQHFVAADYKRMLFQSILYGVFIAVSAYYLLLFLYIREKAYIYWSFSILGVLLIVLSLNGTATALIWPENIWLSDYFILLGICGTCGASALFSKEVLDLKVRPKLGIAMNGILVASLLVWVTSFFAPYVLALKLALVLALSNAVTQITVYLVRLYDGYAPARFVIIAIAFACAGVIINILSVSGRLPSTAFGVNAVGIGVTFSVLFYSLALSNRMNLDRLLREKAQLKLAVELDYKVRDRTEALHKANEKLLIASTTDGLTGLLNRRHFDSVLDAEFRNAYREKQSIAIMMIDVDHFKSINDNYGHPFGDLCIQEVANRVISCLNRPPDICARYGGEEFVVVLPNTDTQGAAHIAESIRESIQKTPISNATQSANVTISIGIACTVPKAADDNDELLGIADTRLYQAKQQGRNRVISE